MTEVGKGASAWHVFVCVCACVVCVCVRGVDGDDVPWLCVAAGMRARASRPPSCQPRGQVQACTVARDTSCQYIVHICNHEPFSFYYSSCLLVRCVSTWLAGCSQLSSFSLCLSCLEVCSVRTDKPFNNIVSIIIP